MNLHLPQHPVPDRVSITEPLPANTRKTYAQLDGPGCIQHLWVVLAHPKRLEMSSRKAIIRIYFDDEPVPYVEAPVGDFFGVMHGLGWYPIDSHFLSAKAWNGYNCYFPMPFAHSARIEFEAGPELNRVFLQADWHRYPGQTLTEPRRFCAAWRREMPTQRYGEDYLMLDADGPGQLLGFVYGVRLLDDVDRWSHGGAENIYIDGQGEHPVFLRGIGGEDSFGAGYGGALHPPETHHYAAMPYYVHEDVGDARPAQRLVGYRFFEKDTLPFRQSVQMRFGCMANDICSTAYWYQQQPVRPFFTMPDWAQLLPGVELPHGVHDLALPETGEWWPCGPFANHGGQAFQTTLPPETAFQPDAGYDGLHGDESAWLNDSSRQQGRDQALWLRRTAHHGFIDFNHVFKPSGRGVGKTDVGAALARCLLHAPTELDATLHIAWDDALLLRVNQQVFDLGNHDAFRVRSIPVKLRAGANTVLLKLGNKPGSNHGGWAFAFRAAAADGAVLTPQAD